MEHGYEFSTFLCGYTSNADGESNCRFAVGMPTQRCFNEEVTDPETHHMFSRRPQTVERDIRNLRRIAWYHQFLQGRDFALDGSRLFALHDTNDI